jgi:hypothetical protein
MSGLSMYHSATGQQSPHCIHAIGIGKTGAQMIDALIRCGEIEDQLTDPRARFTALAVDIGDEDLKGVREYANGFKGRLRERDIPVDRAQVDFLSIDVPEMDELSAFLQRFPEMLQREYPRYAWQPTYEPWIDSESKLPTGGARRILQLEEPDPDQHFPRATAKALYSKAYYDGDRPAEKALERFAESVFASKLPSMVLVFFAMGGGTGSGIAVDLTRHLTNVKLGRRLPVIGVGVMPFSEDPEYHRSASLYTTINEIDCLLDNKKNAVASRVWGDLHANPFNGGFMLIPQEHTWQRLHRYTDAGRPATRHSLRTRVTNKFVDDSFVRYVVQDYGRELFKALRPAGFTGAPHERLASDERTWTIFDIAKFTHPGVEVLPGEPMSKWRSVMKKWTGYIPDFSGLRPGFKTDYIEAHVVSARTRWNDSTQKQLEDTLQNYLLDGDDGTLKCTLTEFFDELTVYANVIIPGVAKTDLTAFYESQKAYDALSAADRIAAHSWLLEVGVALCEQGVDSADGLAAAATESGPLFANEIIRGDTEISKSVADVIHGNIAGVLDTVVATP